MDAIGFSFNLYPLLFSIVFVFLCGIAYLFIRFTNKKLDKNQFFILGSTIFYCLSVFKLTLLPITVKFDEESYPDLSTDFYYQLVPFETIISSFANGNYIQVFGNLVMLLPLPILIGLLKGKVMTFLRSLILIISVSLSIELTQLIINFSTGFPNKIADVDDLILNVLGGIIGWFLINFCLVFIKQNAKNRGVVIN